MPLAEDDKLTEFSQSWERLLGQSDDELAAFCRQLAQEAFGEEPSA